MSDRTLFTYPLMIGKELIAELDVRIQYEGGSWGWLVELFDLNTGSWIKAPRDWHDNILTWAQNERQDELREMVRDYHAGRRADAMMAAAE